MDICRYKPHVAMTLSQLCLSIFLILRQSVFSKGISPLVMVVYEHVLSTVFLSALAFFLEKDVRPPLCFRMLCNAFFLGLLQTPLCQMLLALSLQFNTVTVQSVGVNMIPIVVFMLAVVFRQETFQFRRFHGQAKLWGVVISATGAMVMLLWKGSVLMNELASATFKVTRNEVIGCSLLVVAVLSSASWNILLRHVSKNYPATLSLTAMMCFFGTIQGAVITAVAVRRIAWKLQWEGGLVLFVMLYGSILVSGAMHYIRAWCVQKKGPVFPEAFYPLLIVFSFLLDTILIGNPAHHGRITLCQMLLTLSLQFISATFQSIAINIVPMVVFVLAVVFRQEKFQFLSIHGQAKLWGVLVSTLGAIIMLVWKGSVLLEGTASASFKATRNEAIGCSLLVVAMLAAASWNILVGHVSKMYPATLSLSALMSSFGTIQTAVITAVTETRAAWKLQWEGGLVLFGILYGVMVIDFVLKGPK